MPKVRISDIIVPEIFAPYVIERTAEKSKLWRSGLIEQSDKTNEIASGGGTTANMPFFVDLTGDSEVLSDSTALSVNGISTSKDICVINHRGKAWGANDLAKAKSGDDPMAAIGDLVADWWARDLQKTLIAILRGVFASTTMAAEHVLNISIADGNNAAASNLISSGATVNALKKLGDELDAISAIAMHSDIYYELVKQDEIEFEQPSEQDTVIQRYKGRTVIVDDTLPKVAGGTSGSIYSTYMFGNGVIAYGEGTPEEEAVETDRDILAGDSYLTNRRTFVMHPIGVKWQGNAAGASPTNAEFATAANWARVYTRKNVKLIELKTNG
jgi:hypothetical protein